MGKKQKEDTPSINAVANKDIIQRLNFLYQASVYLQSLDVDQGRYFHDRGSREVVKDDGGRLKESVDKKHKRKNTRSRQVTRRRTSDLARDYIHCMRQVAQKTTVKVDPSLKRSLCLSCNSALVPGVSVSVRVKDSATHMSHLQYTCLYCKAKRRIPLNADELVTDHAPDDSAHATHDNAVSKQSDRRDCAKGTVSRPLPLFARPDAGHVIFCGNDRFSLNEAGCVPFV